MNPIVGREKHLPSIEWLQCFHGGLHARINQVDFARFNQPINQARIPLAGRSQELGFLDSSWVVEAEASAVPGNAETADVTVRFRCVSGIARQCSVSVELEFSNWLPSNFVLMPSAAYAGNRFLSRRIPYSPKLYYVQDIGPDKPIIVTDIPKLNEGPGPSRIQERSGSLATPAIGFYAEASGQGFWLMTTQGNALGDYGLGIEETRDRDRAILSITAPLVRELYSYRICDMRHPSEDVPRDFEAGNEVVITFRICGFSATGLQSLFDRFATARKELTPTQPPRSTLPYSACFALQEAKFNRENFVPEHGYYSVGPRTMFLQDWQIGWTGGMISTYPLLFSGSEQTRENVARNFDWLFPNGISPSGFFWDSGQHGTEWIGGDIRKPHTGNWHLIRKSGDAVYYLIKQFLLMETLGIPVKPAWRDGTQRVCEAFVRLWNAHGQFGQFVDALTGDVVVGGSSSGAIVPAALALAARYYERPDWLDVAVQSGEQFYTQFTRKGLSCGGPGDALQNPDSESAYSLVESYVVLHEATGDPGWLDRAVEASRQFATWVVSYDFAFPPKSMFGQAGIRTTGAVYANTQNKHAAPGICTFSGLALLKLFRATGDRFHLELLHDIAHHLPQYLPHPQNPVGDAAPGRMCERVNMTDWEGVERIGETLRMSTWAETSLMLTTVEIPGLYVQPDRAVVVAFDNITAAIESDTARELVVRIFNPTSLAATVTVLAENRAAALLPLAENALLGARTEPLQPGESRTLAFAK